MSNDRSRLPDGASPGHTGERRSAAGAQKRIVRIRLDGHSYRLLERIAADVEASVDQVVALWLRDRIDEASATTELMRVASELGEIRASLAELAARSIRSGDGSKVRRAGSPAASRRRGSLHSEIVTVLEQSGEPMTAAEIADAIRERDAYRAPRSGHPITGASVSRRIANPYYRSLFERRGRRVGLAPTEQR